MKLFYRKIGAGYPVIILHGLWGASENWLPIARLLSNEYQIILPDLRNHGRSPHHPEHDYNVLAKDIKDIIEQSHFSVQPHLIGHSMGGKALMAFLLSYPSLSARNIVIDIAPLSYTPSPLQRKVFHFVHTFPLQKYTDRQELNFALSSAFPEERIRQLLLKNICKGGKYFEWKINTDALFRHQTDIYGWPATLQSRHSFSPLLFIKGEHSDYIPNEECIKKTFPAACMSVIPETGHWIHAEQPEKLAETIRTFLKMSIPDRQTFYPGNSL